jgi:CRISPR/Cas system CMR-associated protein Cmr5 small subunit
LAFDLPRILDAWDVSVEELPFYLAEACGQQSVEEALAHIQDLPDQSRSMKQKIETIHFWMRVSCEAMLEAKAEWSKKLNVGEQGVGHQPAISPSITFQPPSQPRRWADI